MTEHRPRIAISGSAGVGKTTLAASLAAHLGVPLVEELMRPLIESGLDLHRLTTAERKSLVLEHYEIAISAIRAAIETHGGFVSDRSPADFAAFWLHYGFGGESETDAFLSRAASDSALVDLALMLPWGVIPLVDDGVRLSDRWRQLHFQTVVEGISRRFFAAPHRAEMPDEIVGLDDRIAWVGKRVARTA
ncbi:MAG: AAA family ATPase [Proteobacteria bacterium]|nr:AAA family ATPase [Pseudomonadota bacterium]